jgi:hypothetical protein
MQIPSICKRTQIDIGIEIGYISENIGIVWIQESYELAKMLAGLIKTLKKTSKLSK